MVFRAVHRPSIHAKQSACSSHTGKVSGRILAGEAHQYNGFDDSPVATAEYTDFAVDSQGVDLRLPPCSVAALTLA